METGTTIRSLTKALIRLGAAALAVAVPGQYAAAESAGAQASSKQSALDDVLTYAQNHNTTGFLIIQDGKLLAERNWPTPVADPYFANFLYERNGQGALLEDVASQQKSFVAVLAAIAIDKGLLDIDKPVSAYIGAGWSKASPEQEAKIRIIDVLTMSSGLNPSFGYVAPPGTTFLYNTPVYATTKRVLVSAARQPLDTITRDWLTGPAGMTDTTWRERPAALVEAGNSTALVTSPRDIARFGAIVLTGGLAEDGKRVVSKAGLEALFAPSAANPAYGRLWWLNGSAETVRGAGVRVAGPLIPGAPADLVGALGMFDRKLYVVPGRKLIVVRTGGSSGVQDFDQQLWLRLSKALP